MEAIENLIVAATPSSARSMLDIGSGNGTRAIRIAAAAQIPSLKLLEPSSVMRSYWPAAIHGWPIRAEELCTLHGSFDVITCLWNTLGHIFPTESRIEVLRQTARLLAPGGLAFLDVSHRYNARHYGFWPTLGRMLRDRITFGQTTGDVAARWIIEGESVATKGHVFTHSEFKQAARNAGLQIQAVTSVNYETGQTEASRYAGHLLYILHR